MPAENIFALIVVFLCMAPILIIGVVQFRNKKEPVGFWSGKKPPKKEEIADIRAYNRGHGLMWIVYALAFYLIYAAGAFCGHEAVAAILCMAEVLGGLFVLIRLHAWLEKKYRRTAEESAEHENGGNGENGGNKK